MGYLECHMAGAIAILHLICFNINVVYFSVIFTLIFVIYLVNGIVRLFFAGKQFFN